jgi:hypothetical protein
MEKSHLFDEVLSSVIYHEVLLTMFLTLYMTMVGNNRDI